MKCPYIFLQENCIKNYYCNHPVKYKYATYNSQPHSDPSTWIILYIFYSIYMTTQTSYVHLSILSIGCTDWSFNVFDPTPLIWSPSVYSQIYLVQWWPYKWISTLVWCFIIVDITSLIIRHFYQDFILMWHCQQMLPDVTLEEPGIDKVGYELAARLVYHLDELERTSSTRLATCGRFYHLKIACLIKSPLSR